MKLFRMILYITLMESLTIFEKYKTEFLNNFNSEYLEIKYINDEKQIYLIIYDKIIELNDIVKKLPKERD